MEWKINWSRQVLDEIGLVYQKAEQNPDIAVMLEQLETEALAEARNNMGKFLSREGTPLTPEHFDIFSDVDKETAIRVLGGTGISEMKIDGIRTPTIVLKLTPNLAGIQACALFLLLNSLEKLDGSAQYRFPAWTLAFTFPECQQRGRLWDDLIMKLYPWITVKETPEAETAELLAKMQPDTKKPAKQPDAPAEVKAEKKSFWKKLFG